MLKTDSGRFNNFEGPGKVKINNNVGNDRYWLTGNSTRPTWHKNSRCPKSLMPRLTYQEGLGCMLRPESEWCFKKTFGQAP
jgi:hypothetical protein